MNLRLDDQELRALVAEVAAQLLGELLDWPVGRIALTEEEAANACGVRRHVLRDLRLKKAIQSRKLGRKYVYTRQDILQALEVSAAIGPDSIS